VNDETHPDDEDGTILAVLEALERGSALEPDGVLGPAASGEASETLARLYTEALGLIPYALDPVAPSGAVRERLMAIATGDDTQEVARPAFAPASPAAPVAPFPAPRPPAVRAAPPARRWPLALAAALVLALLGLAGTLYRSLEQRDRQLGEDRAAIERLNGELAAERARVAAAGVDRSELDRLRTRLAALESTFELVTTPAVEMAALRPTGRVPLARQASGRLYIAPDHQHWYLSVHDLQPSAAGQQYQLWFIGPEGPVSGGTFTAAAGAPVNLSSAEMPAGTKAIIITLEPAAGAPAPSGPEVMRASPPVKVL